MKGQEPTATSIEIRLSDGTTLYSESPEHAQEVWDWWGGCETLAAIHGARYLGKPLLKKDAVARRFRRIGGFLDTTDYVEAVGDEVTCVLENGGRHLKPGMTLKFCEDAVAGGSWREL